MDAPSSGVPADEDLVRHELMLVTEIENASPESLSVQPSTRLRPKSWRPTKEVWKP